MLWRIVRGFVEENPGAFTVFVLTTLHVPLQDVLLPHLAGLLYKRPRRRCKARRGVKHEVGRVTTHSDTFRMTTYRLQAILNPTNSADQNMERVATECAEWVLAPVSFGPPPPPPPPPRWKRNGYKTGLADFMTTDPPILPARIQWIRNLQRNRANNGHASAQDQKKNLHGVS